MYDWTGYSSWAKLHITHFKMGWSIIPRTGFPLYSRDTSVPNKGFPVQNKGRRLRKGDICVLLKSLCSQDADEIRDLYAFSFQVKCSMEQPPSPHTSDKALGPIHWVQHPHVGRTCPRPKLQAVLLTEHAVVGDVLHREQRNVSEV